MKRKLTALGLILALTFTPALAAGVEDKFPDTRPYTGFSDVAGDHWALAGIKICYEAGLMNGGGSNAFLPGGTVTVPEAAVVAARIAATLRSDTITEVEGSWYMGSMNYLGSLILIDDDRSSFSFDPTAIATRGDFFTYLSAAIPSGTLREKNKITKLPDTDNADVLRFYNAGVLTGIDRYGTFAADNTLTRAEMAAMVSRVVRSNTALAFTPADYTPFTAAACAPGDIFFEGSGKRVTAEAYLPAALASIRELEAACKTAGIEFNWLNTESVSGLTFLEYVKQTAMSDVEATKAMGTALYQNFDLQVFYSKYIDLNGAAA